MSDKSFLQDLCSDRLHAGSGVDVSVGYMTQAVNDSYSLDLDPVYQRGYVWTREQQINFMGALIYDCDRILPCVIRRTTDKEGFDHYEVIDGKQRISTVMAFVRGDIPARIKGVEFYYKDLGAVDRRGLSTGVRLRWQFVEVPTLAEAIRYYLTLNTGGTVHSAEELARVRSLLP